VTVTLPDETSVAILAATTGFDVEVRGPDGRLLGRFTPAPRPGMMFPEFGVTDEEMRCRLETAEPTHWRTGEEVIARLRDLRDAS